MARSSVKASAFKGWEIFMNAMLMQGKMVFQILVTCAVFQAAVFFTIAYMFMPPKDVEVCLKMAVARIGQHLFFHPTFSFYGGFITGAQLMASPTAQKMAARAIPEIIMCFLVSFVAYIAFPFLLAIFSKKAADATAIDHIRGMQLIDEKVLAKQCRKEGKGLIPFASVYLPDAYLAEHIMIAGKTRVGKTVCMMQQLHCWRAARLPAIVYDFKGEYTAKFYRPGIDHIFNPLDERGAKWILFDDLKNVPDISAITGSLIPPSSGEDKFWSAAAESVLSGIIAALYYKGEAFRNHDALFKVLSSSIEDIAELLLTCEEGAMGHSFIQDTSSKQASGVIASLNSYCCWVQWARNGSGFSVQKWLDNPGDSFIFLTGNPSLENVLKPYMSLIVDLLGKRFLSLPDSKDRKLLFCLDEFGNLARLPIMVRLLTAGGSKGAAVILGFQDFAAIENIYGKELAITILNSCGSSLVLKLSDETTAKIFSGRFGECQYWESSETQTMKDDSNGGISLQRQKTTEKLILPSEIQGLPKLVGYLLVPEHEPAKIALSWKHPANNLPDIHEAFIARPGISLEEAEARAKAAMLAKEIIIMGAPKVGGGGQEAGGETFKSPFDITGEEEEFKPPVRSQALRPGNDFVDL